MPSAEPLRILYLVPDLTDPAVERRIAMLRAGGARVEVAGFHRKPWTRDVEGFTPLGQTHDADLVQRMRAVGAWLVRPRRLAALARDCDVILARNLEMLVLARFARLLRGDRHKLVYECLDIHGAMLGSGAKTRVLRAIEEALLRSCALLIVSSPAFVREYFEKVHARLPAIHLLENKLLGLDGAPTPRDAVRAPGHPWRIGWFGMIRCRRSLELLTALTATLSGRVEVVIRGRPTLAVFPDFEAEISGRAGVRFEGPYRPQELPDHYGAVDFVWGMDFYEAGQNSAWLLPNRLYEGGAFNVPALAQEGVETARWLQSHDTGVVLADPAADLIGFFQSVTESDHADLRRRAERVPRPALICDEAECRTLVDTLRP